ncbi:MAG: hypothetical protein ACOYN3_04775 [Acidimicrobiia bacterium]
MFTKHIPLNAHFNTGADGLSLLTLQRVGIGIEGGLIGMAQANTQFDDVARDVQTRLASGGMLVGEPQCS